MHILDAGFCPRPWLEPSSQSSNSRRVEATMRIDESSHLSYTGAFSSRHRKQSTGADVSGRGPSFRVGDWTSNILFGEALESYRALGNQPGATHSPLSVSVVFRGP